MKKVLGIVLILSLVVFGCKSKKNEPQAGEDSTHINLGEIPDSLKTQVPKPDSVNIEMSKDSVLTGLTKEVLAIFKNREYARLDSFIHPAEGIRFSPYGNINSGSDKKFSREAYSSLVSKSKNKKIKWGSHDGSGDPILLTPNEYFRTFVYDANFLSPDKYGINKILKTGNSINNLKAEYPGADFTESYFSGSRKNGRLDWKSVRLVFKEIGGKYYLVGIVHDQWTI